MKDQLELHFEQEDINRALSWCRSRRIIAGEQGQRYPTDWGPDPMGVTVADLILRLWNARVAK